MKKRIAVICIPQDKLTNGKYPQAQIFELEIPDNRETFDPVEFRISQLMEVYTRAMNHTYFYAYCEEEGEAISQNCNFWSTYCDLSSQTALDYLKSNYKDEQLIEWGLLPQSANDSFLAMIEADRIEAEKKYQQVDAQELTEEEKEQWLNHEYEKQQRSVDKYGFYND